jgi:hypothetical protein
MADKKQFSNTKSIVKVDKFSDGYKSTMDWCSVYLTPQALPKYIYLSPPLIFPTTYNGIRTKNRPVWITPGAAPITVGVIFLSNLHVGIVYDKWN